MDRTASIDSEVDLLVLGGGITGAALAYEASSRGYETLLLEQNDFGSGTSAATGKLIHGGLRYLKKFEFGSVAPIPTSISLNLSLSNFNTR